MSVRSATSVVGLVCVVLVSVVGAVPAAGSLPAPAPAAAAAVSAAQAVQAVGCTGDGCNGLWPGEQGCRDDQEEVFEFQVDQIAGGGRAIIFRSLACHSTWAEFVLNEVPSHFTSQQWSQPPYSGVEQLMRNADGFHSIAVSPTLFRTVMVNWDYSVKACYHAFQGAPENYDPDPEITGNASEAECSGWY
jgi:hypothetical protein